MADGSNDEAAGEDRNTSRLQLLLDVVVFQFKLAADGLRDLVLMPLAILSAIMGLVAGGDDPHRYFRDVLRLGRRTEVWINLFGRRTHRGTSDELISPIRDRVMSEARSNPWLSRAGDELNRKLDRVGERVGERLKDQQPRSEGPQPPDPGSSEHKP